MQNEMNQIDRMPKKNPLSFQIDLSKFEKATDEEKKQQDVMSESASFFKDGMRKLMKNPQASALLQAVLGDMWQAIVSNPLSQGISLREISGFLQAALPESALDQLDAQLAKIPVE